MNPRIVAAFPQVGRLGGVQRFSLHTVRALAGVAADRGVELEVLSLLDAPEFDTLSGIPAVCRAIAFGGRHAAFARAVVTAARRARVVWLGHPFLAPIGAIAGLGRRGAPFVVHAHGIEVWEPLPLHRRVALRRAAAVTCSSQHTATHVVRLQGLDPRRVRVLHPALDPGFGGAGEPGEAARERVILAVCRMNHGDRDKCLHEALRAFATLSPDFPDWRFVVVGGGDNLAEYENLATEAVPGGRVRFLGRIDDGALRQAYRTASIFCLPSLKEGFGMVYAEAMANGLPVVAADIGAIPEVVGGDSRGRLIPPHDEAALAAALRGLMERDARDGLAALRAAAVEHATTRFGFGRFQAEVAATVEAVGERWS
jgi:phosphatidylinositol alpha-1,6-mannosyltransferase